MAPALLTNTNLTKYVKENNFDDITLGLNEEEFLQLPWKDSIKKKLKEIVIAPITRFCVQSMKKIN